MDFSSFFSDVSSGIVLMLISFFIGGACGVGGTFLVVNKNKTTQKINQRGGEGNRASIHNK
ncbi:hypothetical protein [Paenibacillus sp. YAF4_2]|uniref:hypothetical protein n=1 Tax=Paenibacillus sp. YAF4_2 TaxID=3233085 RepID=UPI003F971BD9